MIDLHDFAQKQLELTAEFGKYVFDHPEVEDQLPDGAYVYFEVAGEPEFNEYSRSLAGRQHQQSGAPVVLVRIQGLAPPQGSRLIAPVIEPAPAVA
jgi:hypothetical protein